MYGMSFFLHSRHEGLPANIWILVKNGFTEPQIMIQRNKSLEMLVENAFYMTISDEPNVVGCVGDIFSDSDLLYFKTFILRNKRVLIDYWNGGLDTCQLTEQIKF
jgi:hypothetical protein